MLLVIGDQGVLDVFTHSPVDDPRAEVGAVQQHLGLDQGGTGGRAGRLSRLIVAAVGLVHLVAGRSLVSRRRGR